METKMEKGFPAPLFRDPIFDGASDPTVIWNKKEACYYMFHPQLGVKLCSMAGGGV